MRGELRSWQKEALAVYQESLEQGRQSLLWEATPGAGKTTAALRVCVHQLRSASAKRILIVVPTTHLKLQWTYAAQEIGIHLDPNFGESQRALASDYHGTVVTYQQISNRNRALAQLSRSSIVVLDEVHHSGDGMSWGDALRSTFAESPFVLCLSGTAFRSDNNTIPFVHYDATGTSNPDYVYSYARAIEENVCRPTAFFTYGGDVAWSDGELQGQANFSDALDRTGRTKRLRAALDPESGWIEPMLRDADNLLKATRREHPIAAGLLVASSQRQARALARVLTSVSGTRPTVVLSDDSTASDKLKNFAASGEHWLVACNMVSEGVDIPRLRVGVYATTIRTKMYFRQFLGRIVRRTPTPAGAQPAFCYLPADPWLRTLAEEIEQEQKHYVKAETEELFDRAAFADESERPEREESSWQALRSVNSGVDSIIMGGGQLSLFQSTSSAIETNDFNDLSIPAQPNNGETKLSRAELKEQVAKEIRSLVSGYHNVSGKPHSHIHAILNREQHVENQRQCTEEQLKDRVKLLQQMMKPSL